MPRPKGSKNKPKEAVPKDVNEVPVEKKTRLVGHPIAEVSTPAEIWKPKPDMGSIRPPEDSKSICVNCPHERQYHYQGPRDWCNVSGCKCQAWTA